MSLMKDVQDNIVTTLRSINGSPTYTHTMVDSRVEAGGETLSGLSDVPAFRVVRVDQQFEKQPSNLQYCRMFFSIMMIFLNETEQEVDDWIEDVVKAVTTDITRSSLVHETWVSSIDHSPEVLNDLRIYKVNVECNAQMQFGTA